MFDIAFDHAWLAGKDFSRERGRALLRLLEALEACLGAMYGVSSVSADAAKIKARAAIAKAKGQEA